MVSSSGEQNAGPSDRTPTLEGEDGQDAGSLLEGPDTSLPQAPVLGSAGDYLDDGSIMVFQDSFCDLDSLVRRSAAPGKAPHAGGSSGGGGKAETVVCTLDYDRGMVPVLSLHQGRDNSAKSLALTLNGGVVVPGPSYSLAPGTRLKVEGLGGSSFIIKVRSGAGKQQLLRSRSLQREASGERVEASLLPPRSEAAVVIAGGEKSASSTAPTSTSMTTTTTTTTTTTAAPASMDIDSTLRALRATEQQPGARKERPSALSSIKSTETGPAPPSEDARNLNTAAQVREEAEMI